MTYYPVLGPLLAVTVSVGTQVAADPAARTGKTAIEGLETRSADRSDELPPGADENDIRAARGSAAMLRTERRLAEILEKMKIGGKVPFLRFDTVEDWTYEDGYKGMPAAIEKYDGKKVAMAGFMLPIAEVENIKTFYLIKSLWGCHYGSPPDVNGFVKVNIEGKKGIAYQYDPVLVVGTFRLKKVMDEGYCVCIFQMEDCSVKVIEID